MLVSENTSAAALVIKESAYPCSVNKSYYILRENITPGLGGYDTNEVIGIALSQMVNLNFDIVWGIYEGAGTPYLKRFNNAVLISPAAKTYDGSDAFEWTAVFEGDYDYDKPIDAYAANTPEGMKNAGLYNVDAEYSSKFAYQISIGPYMILPAVLTVKADDIKCRYGKKTQPFSFLIYNFKAEDRISVVSGCDTVTFNAILPNGGRPAHGRYTLNLTGDLKVDNYTFQYESGVLTVTGLYPYEIELIEAAALLLFLAAFSVVFGQEKDLCRFRNAHKGDFYKGNDGY